MNKKKMLIELGQRIRKIRLEKGLTQVELANNTGKDQQHIARIEAGGRNPSYIFLCEVAEGLGISVSELLKF
jgi:putative transcriptional regulator